MAESSTRNVCCIKKDTISELPWNLQETILGFLPIQDAARTSILSRRWRHSWTMIPHLIFSDQFLGSMKDKLNQYHDPEFKAHKFVSVINRALLRHNGPILNFSLRFPEDCDSRIIHDYIDQWIPLFSRNGIKQITIEDFACEDFTPPNFSSLDLTHLRLAAIWFPYTPAFGGFTCMTNLELIDVANFEQHIFDCPVLEKLTLVTCEGLFHTNFRAPNLKCLHQIYRGMTLEYSLAGLENLTESSFWLPQALVTHTKTSNVVKVLGSLHRIEKLSIGMCYIKYLAAGGSPNRLSEPLPCLKTLNVSGINLTDLSEVSCLLCLIRSAPNLCKLHISADKDDEQGNLKDYWIKDFEDCSVDHLKIVTFSHFRGLKAELEVIKFLLGHSPLLKTMFIHGSDDIKKDVALTMAEEMLQFYRASSRAQIKHLEHAVDVNDFGPWVNQFDLYNM